MKKRYNREALFQFVICIIAGAVAFSMLYPFWYCLVQSFNDGYDARVGGVYWFPRKFTIENYKAVFVNPNIVQTFITTAARTVLGTITSVFFTAMFAYGISKNIKFRKLYSIMGLLTMYFSAGLIPYYLLIRTLHLMDNFLVYIIPGLLSYYNALLFVANFKAIPSSIEESAFIDGARPFKIFVHIVLPLSTPILATIALFNGVGAWNDWFTTAIYTRSQWLNTIPVLLQDIINFANNQQEMAKYMAVERQQITIEAIRYATMIVAVAPIIFSYPFLQKYFVKGMLMGAIKA